jgi:hypothetical protein
MPQSQFSESRGWDQLTNPEFTAEKIKQQPPKPVNVLEAKYSILAKVSNAKWPEAELALARFIEQTKFCNTKTIT